MAQSYVFAGVGGYYASKQGGLAGVFRCSTDSGDWKHALSEAEAFTVFVHPRDPNLVFAGTADGVYRSTDRGQTFRRADFPDRGVQVWSFLQDDVDPKRMLAGGSQVSIYRSEDGGASWKRMPDPQLPVHAKMPFSCRVMRFAPHPGRHGEIFVHHADVRRCPLINQSGHCFRRYPIQFARASTSAGRLTFSTKRARMRHRHCRAN